MDTPPIKLAFIIDNEVADVLHTDDRLAAIFLSNPTVIDITEQLTSDPNSIRPGMIYDPNSGTYKEQVVSEDSDV